MADTGHLPLSRSQREWLAYHVSGALLSAEWRRAVTHAVDCARSGVADWTVIAPLNSPSENWTLHQVNNGLQFLHLAQHPFTDWTLPASDKATRRTPAHAHAQHQHQRVMTTCSGAGLSWCSREGWRVMPSLTPVEGPFHRHRLLGFPGERPRLWLFEAEGGYVARLQDMALQTWAPSPKAAIDALRSCQRWHRLTYRLTVSLWTRQIVKELLKQRFGIDLSLASIGTLLARLGLTAQKPLERAYQRDAQAVERWKQQTYPELAAQAKRDKADILFWDESGFRGCGAWQDVGTQRADSRGAAPRPAAKYQCGICCQCQWCLLVRHLPGCTDRGVVR